MHSFPCPCPQLHKELYKYVHAHKLCEELSLRRRRPASLQPVRTPVVERRRRPETIIVHDSNPMVGYCVVVVDLGEDCFSVLACFVCFSEAPGMSGFPGLV